MSHQNCTAFEDRLRDAIADRAALRSPDLRAAAGHCADCRAAWERHALLDRAVAAWARRGPSVDLADAVLSRLAFEEESDAAAHKPADAAQRPAAVSTWPVRGGWTVLAVAAAVLLMLAPLVFGPAAHWRSSTEPVVHRLHPITPEHAPAAELDVLVRDAGAACLTLAGEATQAVTYFDVLVPSTTANTSADPAPAEMAPSWVEEIGHDLQPIGRDVSRAIGFLWDAVPLDDVNAT